MTFRPTRLLTKKCAKAHMPIAGAALFYLVMVPTVLSMPKSPYYDPSIYYSIFRQLSIGRRLYVDIFDNKDPLFFYMYGLFYWCFGVLGPMICETLVGIGMLAVLDTIMKRMRMSAWMRAVALIFFIVMLFHASVYQALQTFGFSIFLLLLSISCAMAGRVALSGCVLALMTAAKLPMVVCCPAVGLYVMSYAITDSWVTALRAGVVIVGAYVAMLLAVTACMWLRGELLGYGDAVYLNFFLAQMVATWKCPAWTSIRDVLTSNVLCMGAVLSATSVGILCASFLRLEMLRRSCGLGSAVDVEIQELRMMRGYAVLTVVLPVAVWFGLTRTPMKGHHFPPIVMMFSLQLIGLLWYLCRYASRLWVACTIVCLLVTISGWCRSGLHVQRWSLTRMRSTVYAQAATEKEVAGVFKKYFGITNVSYLCVGNCSAALFPGVVPPHVRLASRLFIQIPALAPLMWEFDQALTNEKTMVLFDGPGGYFNPMPECRARVEAVISSNFRRVEGVMGSPVYIRQK